MIGCVDLGINTAYRSKSLHDDPLYLRGFVHEPKNVLNQNRLSYTRQALPKWGSPGRENKVWEPFPVWIGHSGMWGDGPARYSGWAAWQVCDKFYASTHGSCVHLTCAANCRLDLVNGEITVGEIHDFAIRPCRWQEREVQEAYEAASAGAGEDAVTAAEIAAMADIGMLEFDDLGREIARGPTEAGHEEDLARAHAWDRAAASFLAFGLRDKRPFTWRPQWADGKMAVRADYGYDRPDPNVYGTTCHFSYESGKHGLSGQGFTAFRKETDGALTADDWGRIGYAIAHSWNAPKHIERKEDGTRVRKLNLDTMGRPNRANEAFDLRVYKTVTLTRGKWRVDKNGNPIQHGSQGRPPNVVGKECAKRYDIDAWWISGAAPKDYGHTTFGWIPPEPEWRPEQQP